MQDERNIASAREQVMYGKGYEHGYAAGKVAAREEMLIIVVIGLILFATFTILSPG